MDTHAIEIFDIFSRIVELNDLKLTTVALGICNRRLYENFIGITLQYNTDKIFDIFAEIFSKYMIGEVSFNYISVFIGYYVSTISKMGNFMIYKFIHRALKLENTKDSKCHNIELIVKKLHIYFEFYIMMRLMFDLVYFGYAEMPIIKMIWDNNYKDYNIPIKARLQEYYVKIYDRLMSFIKEHVDMTYDALYAYWIQRVKTGYISFASSYLLILDKLHTK